MNKSYWLNLTKLRAFGVLVPTMLVSACGDMGAGGEPSDRVVSQSFSPRRETAAGGGALEGQMRIGITYDEEAVHDIAASVEDLESAGTTTATYALRDMQANVTLEASLDDTMNTLTVNDGAGILQVRLVSETQAALVHDGREEMVSIEEMGARMMTTLTSARVSPHLFVALDHLVQQDNDPAHLGFKSFFKRVFRGVRKVIKFVARPWFDAWRRAYLDLLPPTGSPSSTAVDPNGR